MRCRCLSDFSGPPARFDVPLRSRLRHWGRLGPIPLAFYDRGVVGVPGPQAPGSTGFPGAPSVFSTPAWRLFQRCFRAAFPFCWGTEDAP